MERQVCKHAKLHIDKYKDINDINRVCPHCGFEKTELRNNVGYCLTCRKEYTLLTDKKTKSCIIS